ncbi:MAG: M23 family metallopeptidase [Bacteroidota bacterium]
MNELTELQVIFIRKEIERNGIKNKTLREELTDHFSEAVLEKLSEGMDFHKSFQSVLKSFGEEGLLNLEKETNTAVRQAKTKKWYQFIPMKMAACLSLLVVSVGAQDPPDIPPKKGELKITSSFGARMHPIKKVEMHHNGVDIKMEVGTEVLATSSGTIEEVRYSDEGYGNKVVIRHDKEYQTMYGQLSEINVRVGQKVKKGDVIALSGNSGASTGPHLHYEVVKNGEKVDPENYF